MAKKANWKYDFPANGIIPLWTDETPTEPGLYWFQLGTKGGGMLRSQRVYLERGELVVYNTDSSIPVKQLIRLWAGPLLEPEAGE